MSAPNANAPNEGIIGSIANSVQNAVNYVSETIQGSVRPIFPLPFVVCYV